MAFSAIGCRIPAPRRNPLQIAAGPKDTARLAHVLAIDEGARIILELGAQREIDRLRVGHLARLDDGRRRTHRSRDHGGQILDARQGRGHDGIGHGGDLALLVRDQFAAFSLAHQAGRDQPLPEHHERVALLGLGSVTLWR